MLGVSVPFMQLRPGDDATAVDAAIRRVIDRGWFILGPEVEQFERAFADACGAPCAVGVGNGTDAIALVLRALGIGPGDEVITTPLSAAYTALAVTMVGARPVFADIDPVRYTLDPAAAEAAITSRTRAIIPVHLYGQAADLAGLAAVAARHRLALVEDCCQAHLARCGGQAVGTIGVAGAFSFYPTKNLGALGDGGAIVTRDAQLADRLKRLRNGGQTSRYHHAELGINSRLDELQAAVLTARLPFLRDWTARRRAIAARYRSTLGAGRVRLPAECDPGHVYHLFVVGCDERDRLQEHLRACGVETLIHYPVPIPHQPAFLPMQPADCPVATRLCGQILSLPLWPAMSDDQVDAVARAVNSAPLAWPVV